MPLFRHPEKSPLWRDEFSIHAADERYVTRRQFAKFLTLASLGMFAGNLWILLRAWFYKKPVYPTTHVASLGEIPVGDVKLFHYPTAQEQCILIRLSVDAYVAYSQKCTHLSCAVYYAPEHQRLECPCHEGYFSVRDGSVLQGPPPRPLPRVVLEKLRNDLFATGIEIQSSG
ncbi:MAG TPA: Rieske 2Fe-2S domain-containing protein [Candidatus Acidoferrales bacterium]|nr:Rieske 2Fe-2S domain-containing protein [Candidatus Acidoferrales bacterium]